MNRLARLAAATLAAAGTLLSTAGVASADQEPVLVGQHGAHQIFVATGEDYVVEDPQTYWDFVPLDGMCGFAGSALTLSDMDETFFIQTHLRGAKEGAFTGTGKILDETFVLAQLDEAGREVRTFTGTGDEYAQFRGTGAAGDQADTSVNLRVVFRGSSADGHHLAFTIKLRLRTDPATGVPTRMSAAVETCHVR